MDSLIERLTQIVANANSTGEGTMTVRTKTLQDSLETIASLRAELAALRATIAEAPVGWYDSTAGQVFMDSNHKPLCAAGICDVRILLENPTAEDGRLSQPHLPEMRQAGLT
jgi:hypothetical protein